MTSQNRQDIREFFKRKRSESPNESAPCVKKSAQDFSKSTAESGLNEETTPAENNGNPSGFDGMIENSLQNGALADRTNKISVSEIVNNKELPQFSSESSEDDNEKNVSSSDFTKISTKQKKKIKKCSISNSNSSDVEVSFNYSKKTNGAKDHDDDEMGPREFSDEESSNSSSHTQ